MKVRVRFAAIVAILGVLIGVASQWFLTTGLSYDALLTLRHALFGDRHHDTADADVVVVNIDEATFRAPAFNKPFPLWAPQFATVLDALEQAGAKVVGVDIIFATTVEAEPSLRGHDQPLRATLARLGAEDRVVLAQTDAGGGVFAPHKSIRIIASLQNDIRFANVKIDLDGVIRYMPLWHGAEPNRTPSFALTLAQRAGFDAERLPQDLRYLAPNYADAAVAPVYAMQDVHGCAIAGDLEPLARAFAGKIVLLGADLDVEDRKVTPGRAFVRSANPVPLPCGASAGQERAPRRTIPGVFIHAQAINDLLRGELARFWPTWVALAALAVMSTTGSLLAIFVRAPAASLLTAAALVVWTGGTVGMAALDWFGPLLGGVAAIFSAFLIGLGLRTFVIDRERRRMALALSRYLDIHLANRLMESDSPPELGGETREVTIWFSDIAGFSTVAERMDAKELVTELNAHFAILGQAIEAEGGIIDKYVGDAVVAIFGALVPPYNHAAAAMRAALSAQQKLRAAAGKGGAFKTRIGLNTGSCVVGNVGWIERARAHINYTAIGDTVNVAARLEAANKDLGTSILASESTVQSAGAGFVCRHLGPIHVKGRAEEVVVHEVVGLQSH